MTTRKTSNLLDYSRTKLEPTVMQREVPANKTLSSYIRTVLPAVTRVHQSIEIEGAPDSLTSLRLNIVDCEFALKALFTCEVDKDGMFLLLLETVTNSPEDAKRVRSGLAILKQIRTITPFKDQSKRVCEGRFICELSVWQEPDTDAILGGRYEVPWMQVGIQTGLHLIRGAASCDD